MKKYILVDKRPVVENNLMAWGRWFEKDANRRVASDQIGGILISTVFLGLDHSFSENGPPLLFETMIFGGHWEEEGYQERGIIYLTPEI